MFHNNQNLLVTWDAQAYRSPSPIRVVESTGVLPCLSLLNAKFGVRLGHGRFKASLFCGHQQEAHVGRRRPGDHVFDDILVPRRSTTLKWYLSV